MSHEMKSNHSAFGAGIDLARRIVRRAQHPAAARSQHEASAIPNRRVVANHSQCVAGPKREPRINQVGVRVDDQLVSLQRESMSMVEVEKLRP